MAVRRIEYVAAAACVYTSARMVLLRIFSLVIVVILSGASLAGPQIPAPPFQHPLDPAGELVLDSKGAPAEGSLPVAFVRSPDTTGPGGAGRYLVVVNSGYGVQFTAKGNHGQQQLQVIDLTAQPAPMVVQTVYFPTPDSVNVGLVFATRASADGTWPLYASGGFGNRIWKLTFTAGAAQPISPGHDADTGPLKAPFIDLKSAVAPPPTPAYNSGQAPIYPTGLAINASGRQLYVANNLGDTLGIVDIATGAMREIPLADPSRPRQFVYPYDVQTIARPGKADKVYVSCWNDSTVAVADPGRRRIVAHIPVGAHPNAMIASADGRRLFVASANSDTVSVIDTASDRELERISVALGTEDRLGNSSQALALSDNERALFVANAQTASVAVVQLGANSLGPARDDWKDREETDHEAEDGRSRVAGFVPTARYPSALAVVAGVLYVGNGKGEPPARPNPPSAAFPPTAVLRGAYSVSLMRSSIRRIAVPDRGALTGLTSRVLAANGLTGSPVDHLFSGPSPITHVVYVIKENRTYDQVFGDVAASGDGTHADGDPSLAIFGSGDTAARPRGARQDITPNHRALALRFGLFDRFFVNSEASPDGHNWATAAFSTDYVDKSFRWNYSGRGRTYDFEGFNRLPDLDGKSPPPRLHLPATAADLAAFLTRFVPYKNGWRDASEPDSLYLWDAAARAHLSYRNYGEFIGTLSAEDVAAINARKERAYPDVSANVVTVPTKQALEQHFNPNFRAFDLWTPDAMTTASYEQARATGIEAVISPDHADPRFRGTSRLGVWIAEFNGFVADLAAGKPDRMPVLSVMHLPNDHTAGMKRGFATPQFLVADNDYALGRVVQAISHSPYWKNTAVLVVEDDAQDGPDHVDAHRSPVLVVSAYNKPGQLVHDVHNTVSLIRTLELLLGIPPMNLLDASAAPMDIFRDQADLTPFDAQLPTVAPDNLLLPAAPRTVAERRWMDRAAQLPLGAPDMANPRELNEAIWFAARGSAQPMPAPARLALVDAIQSSLDEEAEDKENREPMEMALVALRRSGQGKY
jgi:YVTN family beta-propeller protein